MFTRQDQKRKLKEELKINSLLQEVKDSKKISELNQGIVSHAGKEEPDMAADIVKCVMKSHAAIKMTFLYSAKAVHFWLNNRDA